MMPMFLNVEALNGAEVWRTLVVPVNLRTPEHRFRLHGRVRTPAKASKMSEVPERIGEWESDLRKFKDAKGKDIDDEYPRIIMPDIHPKELPFTFIKELRKIQLYAELRVRVGAEVEYYKAGADRLHGGDKLLTADAQD